MAFSLLDAVIKIAVDDQASSQIAATMSGIGKKASAFAATAIKAAGAAAAAIGGVAAASVKTGAAFDASMSQVAATMGTTVDQIQELRDFALEMGRTTAFSASQAAEALNYMALAGYDSTESMSMLPTVLNLAAAGGIELARASDMITDAQSALGLTFEDTVKLVDQMAKASSSGNTSVAQLGDAILTVGGLAQNMAGGTVELAAALTALADNGVKGAEGGTKLRNMILSLSTPTADAAKKLKDLGIQVFDAEGNMRSFTAIFPELQSAMADLTMEEQTDIINTIFNKTDIAAVNALLGTTTDRWDELTTAIENSSGAAANMADTQLDNLEGDVTLLKSAFEGLQIAISDELSPYFREFVQEATDGISKITELIETDGLTGAIHKLSEEFMNGIEEGIENLPDMISSGIDVVGVIATAIEENLPQLTELGGEMLYQIVVGLVENMPKLYEIEQRLKLAAIEGLVGLVVGFKERGAEAMLNLINGILEKIGDLIIAGAEVVTNFFIGVGQKIGEGIDKGREMVQKIGEGVKDLASEALAWGSDLVQSFIDGIMSRIGAVGDAAAQIAEKVRGFLHFSEPDVGPLSDFHTYAPDMMKLFAEGVKKNTHLVTDQIEKSFDFGKQIQGSLAVEYHGKTAQSGSVVNNFYPQSMSEAQMDYMAGAINRNFGGALA